MSKHIEVPEEDLKLILDMQSKYDALIRDHSRIRRDFTTTELALIGQLTRIENDFRDFIKQLATRHGIVEEDLSNWSLELEEGVFKYVGEGEPEPLKAEEEEAEEKPEDNKPPTKPVAKKADLPTAYKNLMKKRNSRKKK